MSRGNFYGRPGKWHHGSWSRYPQSWKKQQTARYNRFKRAAPVNPLRPSGYYRHRGLVQGGGINYTSHRFGRITSFRMPPRLMSSRPMGSNALVHVPRVKARMSRKYMAKKFIRTNRRSLYLAGGVAAASAGAYAIHRRRRTKRNYKGQFAGSYSS